MWRVRWLFILGIRVARGMPGPRARRRALCTFAARLCTTPQHTGAPPTLPDVIIASSMRSGGTWASHIAHQIRMKGTPPDFFWQEDVVPWLDIHQVFLTDFSFSIRAHTTRQYCPRILPLSEFFFPAIHNTGPFPSLLSLFPDASCHSKCSPIPLPSARISLASHRTSTHSLWCPGSSDPPPRTPTWWKQESSGLTRALSRVLRTARWTHFVSLHQHITHFMKRTLICLNPRS